MPECYEGISPRKIDQDIKNLDFFFQKSGIYITCQNRKKFIKFFFGELISGSINGIIYFILTTFVFGWFHNVILKISWIENTINFIKYNIK